MPIEWFHCSLHGLLEIHPHREKSMIDTSHCKTELVEDLVNLYEIGIPDAADDLYKLCEIGFRGDQSLEFYNGLFSAYVNAYHLIRIRGEEDERKGKESGVPGIITSLAIVIAFVAKKLLEMQKSAENKNQPKFTPEDALKEYQQTCEPTTKERNHLIELFEKLAGRNPTKLIEGANCPKCKGKISKDNYCRDCGYGL